MSFINAIQGLQRGVQEFLGQKTVNSNIARSVITNMDNDFVNQFLDLPNDAQPSKQPAAGQKITLNPDTTNYIPVIYGETYTSGMLTDAIMAADGLTMWFCITISEKTGPLLNGSNSELRFKEVYYKNCRLAFKSDGYTVDQAFDRVGNITDRFSGLIEVYPFAGNSDSPTGFTTEFFSNTQNAYNLFPGWQATDFMTDLNFVLVKIKYDADNDVRGIEDFHFRVENTMKETGDVLYDYATNTRYGAGIPSTDLELNT